MAVYAVTPIQHGKADGEVVDFEVGAELTEEDFSEQELRDFIVGGSAVEVGKRRKYSEAPDPSQAPAGDDATRLRDELIARSQTGESGEAAVEAAAAGEGQ
jgi:hypothetical protein